jgi:hypothetical protein
MNWLVKSITVLSLTLSPTISKAQTLEQCLAEYERTLQILASCDELVQMGEDYIIKLKERQRLDEANIKLLEQELTLTNKKLSRSDAWYNSKLLWTAIGFGLGVGLVFQIDSK